MAVPVTDPRTMAARSELKQNPCIPDTKRGLRLEEGLFGVVIEGQVVGEPEAPASNPPPTSYLPSYPPPTRVRSAFAAYHAASYMLSLCRVRYARIASRLCYGMSGTACVYGPTSGFSAPVLSVCMVRGQGSMRCGRCSRQ
eukprot:3505304-Rhodomonas_salina.4